MSQLAPSLRLQIKLCLGQLRDSLFLVLTPHIVLFSLQLLTMFFLERSHGGSFLRQILAALIPASVADSVKRQSTRLSTSIHLQPPPTHCLFATDTHRYAQSLWSWEHFTCTTLLGNQEVINGKFAANTHRNCFLLVHLANHLFVCLLMLDATSIKYSWYFTLKSYVRILLLEAKRIVMLC